MKKLSFAVIGAGPAGFYMGKCLSKLQAQPIIHIYQKQYCPFGLLRYGVAPDHVTVKKSENTLSQIANYPNFKYFGNANITQSVLKQLKQSYSGVVYAIGAQQDNLPFWMPKRSENFQFITAKALNARDIVYWYNNHPQYQNVHLDFSNKRDVLIIGNGNVAIDIARVLLKPIQMLIQSEISANALETLKKSNVTNVILAARRGFTHSAFSLKEIREITTAKIAIYCIEQQLDKSFTEASAKECTDIGNHHAAIVRMNKRKIDFVKNNCKIIKRSGLDEVLKSNQKKVVLRFLLDPLQADQNQMRFVVTKLKGEAFAQTIVKTDQNDAIKFDLLVNSTGFKVEPIKHDNNRGINSILNSNGCVVAKQNDKIERGEYAVGWCKTGPKGVIDQTLLGCQQTYNNIRIHIKNNFLQQKPISNLQFGDHKYSFDKYLKLKQLELSMGDRQKFIKKKLSHKEVAQFFNKQ